MIIKIIREIDGKIESKFIEKKDLGFFQISGWKKDNTPSEPHVVKKGRKRED